MSKQSDQQADDLALIENCALHSIFERDGMAAFDRASRTLLTSTAAVIACVHGRTQLSDIMDDIKEAQRQEAQRRHCEAMAI